MLTAFLVGLFFACQLHGVLGRAVPGIHLSGRDYADQNPAQKVKTLYVLPRDGQKIAPKVLIISMVINSLARL